MSSSEGPNCGVNVGIDSKDRVNPGRIRARLGSNSGASLLRLESLL